MDDKPYHEWEIYQDGKEWRVYRQLLSGQSVLLTHRFTTKGAAQVLAATFNSELEVVFEQALRDIVDGR